MFENLTNRLTQAFSGYRGRKLTEENISRAIREVRTALLEADVALEVVIRFIDAVKRKSVGQQFVASVRPGDMFIQIVHEELVQLMGSQTSELNLATNNKPAVILMAGLQGTGKTTTAAKLAKRLQATDSLKVGMVSADVYRPAAIEQLRVLSSSVGAQFFDSSQDESPISIVQNARAAATEQLLDVLIVDTAGRLAVDEAMMAEIKQLHDVLEPAETLFVVDAMTGQDAASTARTFDRTLSLTGVILTKVDGDSRGGAALSVRAITNKPVKFLGVGEDVEELELFHPDRLASRILGMGDIVSLVEEAQRNVDASRANRMVNRMLRGSAFTFEDMRDQIQQMLDMGGMKSVLDRLPNMPKPNITQDNDTELSKFLVIIDSMTLRERAFPNLVKMPSRKQRIATGSGTQMRDVNAALRKLQQLQKATKKLGRMTKSGKLADQMSGILGSP